MTNTPKHTIIFDIGNVLIGWNPRLLYNKVFDTPEEADWFVNNITHLDWNEEQDRGRPVAVATEELVREHPKWEREIRMYYDRWTEHFSGAIAGSVEVLKALEASGEYRLLALTNWSAELFPWARENFDFLDIFEDIMVSGEVKMKKPNPDIFLHLAETYKLGDFSGCLFIDDSARNCETARSLGLETIQFVGPEELKGELRKLEVLK
ncbi:HAD family phosphatase [Neolewinella aurantiaca]|uniref:HAD family phosphatase n=1 Tax=Neolewinella aurantiaca TaxID=2602767 RepID=A0A5C7FDG2_9BACT|nr:HAD family phosphatase [Neolewinella aurantiaca]TXF88220.1 HAD family phosphatase [Neolewinella aurantiaca]